MPNYKLTFHSSSNFSGLSEWLKGYFGIPDVFLGSKSKNSLCIEIDLNGQFFEATGINAQAPRIGRYSRISFEDAGVDGFKLENEVGEEIPTHAGKKKYLVCIKDTLVMFQSTLAFISKTTDDAKLIISATDVLPQTSKDYMARMRFTEENMDVAIAKDKMYISGDGVHVGYNVFKIDFVPIVSNTFFDEMFSGFGRPQVSVEVDGSRIKLLSDTLKIVSDTSGEDKSTQAVNVELKPNGDFFVTAPDGSFSVKLGEAHDNAPFSFPISRGDLSAFLYGNDSSSNKVIFKVTPDACGMQAPRIVSAHVMDGHSGEESKYFIIEVIKRAESTIKI